MISVFMSLCEQSAWLLTVWGEGQTLLSHPRHFCEEVDWSETGKNPSGYCVDPTNRVSVASTPPCVCVCVCACVHMRLTLCNPIDCSPSGSSVHGVFQARKLKCFAVSYSRGSSKPRDQSWVSLSPALAGDSLPLVPPGKPTVHKRQSLWGKG